MGMKKINRWFKSLIHGYDLPQLKKSISAIMIMW